MADGTALAVRSDDGHTMGIDKTVVKGPQTLGMDAIVPPVGGGKADDAKYGATVIRAYNGADEAMPETFTRLKRKFDDKNRTVERIDDEATTADFVIIVGSKTQALKP